MLIYSSVKTFAQTEQRAQFWNEYAFVKNLNADWALEADIGITTSSTPNNSDPFNRIIQFYVRGWVHYYPSDRWRLTAAYSYYFNKNVPELYQEKAPELRASLQATYVLIKKRARVNLRARIEDRHLKNEDDYFEAVTRFRFQAKLTYPINNPLIEKNTLYTFTSDEVFFKTQSSISGNSFFDRNRFTIGLGYAFPGDVQAELSYANENLPRDNRTEIYHAIQVNVIFNDVIPSIKKAFSREKTSIDNGNGP